MNTQREMKEEVRIMKENKLNKTEILKLVVWIATYVTVNVFLTWLFQKLQKEEV